MWDYLISPGNATTDRTVGKLTLCSKDLEFMSVNETKTSNRICTRLAECALGTEFELTPKTTFSDRVCQNCTECPENKYALENGCNGLDDRKCEIKDTCTGAPCDNGGTCVNNNGFNYTCACAKDYAGDQCRIRLSVCQPPPQATCINGGQCTSFGVKDENFNCACQDPFFGTNCQLNQSVCEPSPCLSNGTCVPLPKNEFECDCIGNTTGTYCQVDKAICFPGGAGYEACNGGECKPGGNGGFECENCPGKQCGNLCEREKDETGACTGNYDDAGAAAGEDSQALAISASIAGVVVVLAIVLVLLVVRYAKKEINKNAAYEAFKEGKDIEADEWEIDRLLLTIGPEIGSGNFGNVNKGLYMNPNLEMTDEEKMATFISAAEDVAIKSLKLSNLDYGVVGPDGAELENPAHHQAAKDFFDEMGLMKEIGNHRNVVSLVRPIATPARAFLALRGRLFVDMRVLCAVLCLYARMQRTAGVDRWDECVSLQYAFEIYSVNVRGRFCR